MNPRYSQGPQVSSQDKLLQQLMALKQGGTSLPQQQLAQQDQHQQMANALQLLGLQQRGQDEDSRRAFDQQQLAQSGTQFNTKLAQDKELEQNKLAMEQQRYQQALTESGIANYSRLPGASTDLITQMLKASNPTLGSVIDQDMQQRRAQAIATVAPALRLISDPAARELHGTTMLHQFPGAYEEALAQAFPQGTGTIPAPQASGLDVSPITDTYHKSGLLGLAGDVLSQGFKTPPVDSSPRLASPLGDSPLNPFNMLLGNDNMFSNYLRMNHR